MSAGVAERPLDGCDLSISGCTWSSSDGLRRLLFAQAIAAELQAMSIVNDAIQDGIGQGGIPDQGMPGRRFAVPSLAVAVEKSGFRILRYRNLATAREDPCPGRSPSR